MKEISFKELTELQQSGQKVLVDFFTPSCGPCKMLMPFLESLATEHPEVTFVKVNVWSDMEEASKYNVRVVPTILFYNGENLVDKLTGTGNPKSKYTEILESL